MTTIERFHMPTTERFGVRIEQVARPWLPEDHKERDLKQRITAWDYGDGVVIVTSDDRFEPRREITLTLTDPNLIREFAGALYEMAYLVEGAKEGCEFQESV